MASKKRKNIDSVRTTKLDLGLEELISPVAQSNVAVAAIDIPDSISPEAQSKSNEGETKEVALSTFERLYRDKDYNKLGILAESEMQSEDYLTSTEARLWWVRAQLEQRSVPLSILAAPLNSLSEMLVADFSLTPTERKLTVALYAHAAALLRDIGKPLTSVDSSLAKKFTERAQLLDGKSASPAEVKPTLVKEKAEEIELQAKQEKLEVPAPQSPRGSKAVRRVIALTLSIFALWYCGVSLSALNPFRSEPMELADIPLQIGAASAPLRAVELARINGVKEIDALYYQMRSGNSRSETSAPSAEPQARLQPAAVVEIPKEAEAPSQPAPKKSTIQAKEKIDLTGPLEGTQFPELTQGVQPVKHEVELTRRSDLFGGGTQRMESGERTRMEDGAVAPGTIYSVIATTKVLARPSYRAVVLAVLDRGARIEVIERQGEWLRLRSRMGQAGYILAQDAESTATQ